MVCRPNYFAAGRLDRAAHLRRDRRWLSERLADPASRFVLVWRSRNLFTTDEGSQPVFLSISEVSRLLEDTDTVVLLGVTGETAYFAVDVSYLDDPATRAPLAERGQFRGLRGMAAVLDHAQASLLAYARGMVGWHRRHRFCGVCGQATRNEEGGHLRVCSSPSCGSDHFPRTDPAVIMLVSREDRCLLGRKAEWPEGVYSTLAGFVEPGESLEDAVVREVKEETGVEVVQPVYHSSQPWPFPSSLMLGFTATAEGEMLRVNREEMEDARWFQRDELLQLKGEGRIRFPPRLSIARRLIEDWLRHANEE